MQLYHRVRRLALALEHLGVGRGDRVVLLAENRWEWAVTDFAVLALGAVDVPIYPTLLAEQVGALLRDSGARVAVVSTRGQYEKVAAERAGTALEHILLMDEERIEGVENLSALLAGGDEPAPRDADFDRRLQAVSPGDLATLIYTSGTTGEPKGVMLTHGNLASNIGAVSERLAFGREDSCISFLPLSHITARIVDYLCFAAGASIAYCPSFAKLVGALGEVRPTIFVAVPRVYEKVRQEAERKAAHSGLRRRILAWAIRTGGGHARQVASGSRPASLGWRLAERLVYDKLRAVFGGRVRLFISGGAPLGIETATWFASAGIPILEGYGLTETSPVIAINAPRANRMGSVGIPLPIAECRLAADGELLVRGPSVFQGYWQKPAATAEAFDGDGFFRTGDIASIDGDGFLSITDRKKEMLKTSGGKLVAPQAIEGRLKTHLLVGNAVVVGDRHKFLCALLSPNLAALEAWARQQGIPAMPAAELVEQPRVVAEYHRIVEQVNRSLASFESIKRFRLVPVEWSVESGELTPSLKLKRRVLEQKYAAEIASLYGGEAAAHA
jgi:long-chain acyl-CoA synthetase